MRLLLDTHIFLWYISGSDRLPEVFKASIRDQGNEVLLSAAAIWECVIKHSLGKLLLPEPPAEYLPKQRAAHEIDSLPIVEGDMAVLARLPPHHRDPFDRLMVAQALHQRLTIVTVDPLVRTYEVPLLDA